MKWCPCPPSVWEGVIYFGHLDKDTVTVTVTVTMTVTVIVTVTTTVTQKHTCTYKQGLGSNTQYRGAWEAFRGTLAGEGLRGIYAGVLPRIVWMGMRGAVYFSTLEAARKMFLPDVYR
jgi:hypothetical protein